MVLPAGDAGIDGDCPGESGVRVRGVRGSSKGGNGLSLAKDGTFTNSLLAQTITLSLNVRLGLGELELHKLCPTFVTKDAVPGPDGTLIPNPDPGPDGIMYTADDTRTFTIPDSIIAALGPGATVADLLEMANNALAGVDYSAFGVSLSDLTWATDAINNGFHECRFLVGCVPTPTTLSEALVVHPDKAGLGLCDDLAPVTSLDLLSKSGALRGDALVENMETRVPSTVLNALDRLGLVANVAGLSELERMVIEGHGYLAGAEAEDVIAIAARVARLIRYGDLVSLCR